MAADHRCKLLTITAEHAAVQSLESGYTDRRLVSCISFDSSTESLFCE